MTAFDVDSFLQQTINDKLDDERIPVPEGEYEAEIIGFDGRSGERSDGSSWYGLSVQFRLDNLPPETQEKLGKDSAVVRQMIFLDVLEDGSLDTGPQKNIALGRLRSAVGQKDTVPWSPSMLLGQRCMVQVQNRLADDGSGRVFDEVRSVLPI